MLLLFLLYNNHVEELRPIRERYESYIKDKAYLEECYRKADEIALKISSRTMNKVPEKSRKPMLLSASGAIEHVLI